MENICDTLVVPHSFDYIYPIRHKRRIDFLWPFDSICQFVQQLSQLNIQEKEINRATSPIRLERA